MIVVGDQVIHIGPDLAGILNKIGGELRKRQGLE
jgi:hypothetical protein